jgi:AcrR family transcriptional regulator
MARPARAVREPYDRDRVVRAALRVFTERGYDGASMDHIARALGIHKSSLYHHIQGKEQILDEALRGALSALLAVLNEPESLEGASLERLRHVIRRTVEITCARLDEVTVLLRVRGNTATERWAMERRREFDRRVQGLVEAAIREGDLGAGIDPRLATRLVFGMTNSIIEWYRPEGRLSPEAIGDAVVSVCLDGLRRSAAAG